MQTPTPIPLPVPPDPPIVASPETAPKQWPTPIVNVPESKQQTMPSLLAMSKNLAYTAGTAIAQAVVNQQVVASESIYNKRLETCNNCEAYDKDQHRCFKCGCYMKAKARMIAAKCPLNKWAE